MIKIVKYLIVWLSVVSWQIAVNPFLPKSFQELNLPLVMVILFGFVYSKKVALIWAIFFAFAFDLYSVMPFGSILFLYVLTLLIVNGVFLKMLTNKSFYSFCGLLIIASATFWLVNCVELILYYFFENHKEQIALIFSASNLYLLFKQIILNCFVGVILYFVVNFFSNKFKAVYIDTTRN